MPGTYFSIKIATGKNHKAYRDRTRFTLSLSVCATIKPGVACPRHLQEGDWRENACPPVAYFSDSIGVSPHIFRLADKFHLDRSIIWENMHKRTKHEAQARSLPALLPAVTLSLAVLSILLASRRYSQFSSLLGGTLNFFLAPRRYSQFSSLLGGTLNFPRSSVVLSIFLASRRHSQISTLLGGTLNFPRSLAVLSNLLLLIPSDIKRNTLSQGLRLEDRRPPVDLQGSSLLGVSS